MQKPATKKDGKGLEELVSFIETRAALGDCKVKLNKREYDAATGFQTGEFDIVVEGQFGTTEISWLIECRDRPSDGPQASSWIQQLVGRRMQFGFNKVTAVSSSGFAAPAVVAAQNAGIDLREVRSCDPEEFSDIFDLSEIDVLQPRGTVLHVGVIFGKGVSGKQKKAVNKTLLCNTNSNDKFLVSSKHGTLCSINDAISHALMGKEVEVWRDIKPNATPRKTRVSVEYPFEDDYYYIDTKVGSVRIKGLEFFCEVFMELSTISPFAAKEYIKLEKKETVSKSLYFSPYSDRQGNVYSLEMHRLVPQGKVVSILRHDIDPNAQNRPKRPRKTKRH